MLFARSIAASQCATQPVSREGHGQPASSESGRVEVDARGLEPPQPLVAFVTFYRGDTKAFETNPVPISERVANRLNTMPIKISFPLDKLATGEYNCQITVLSPNSQKAAFWNTQIMLVP